MVGWLVFTFDPWKDAEELEGTSGPVTFAGWIAKTIAHNPACHPPPPTCRPADQPTCPTIDGVHNPFVPETLEGWSVLHLMFRVDWGRLGDAYPGDRQQMTQEAAGVLAGRISGPDQGATTLVHLLGHKGDLMVVGFRRTFDDLGRLQLALSRTRLHAYLQPLSSYVSIVELGMYEMTAKIHRQLADQGMAQGSDSYNDAFDQEMERQRQRVAARLFPPIPSTRYVCFYPMNKRRGEVQNWYTQPFGHRAELMLEHGKVGREYAGKVTQVISGSIGFDDWEWGVDLFADDPLVFKKLIYEMRFDEASARFAEFGPFYVGMQFSVSELGKFLEGELPELVDESLAAAARRLGDAR